MSKYQVVECDIKEESALIEALVDIGFKVEDIQIHKNPVNLEGYQGDKRQQKAHVVVSRRKIKDRLGIGASNDIGFEKVNGKYIAHVSDYDLTTWWNKKENRFKQVAAMSEVVKTAKKQGYIIQKKEEKGLIKLHLVKL